MEKWQADAENFLQNEKEFRLGFLASEARNPLTYHLDEDFRKSTADGVRTLLSCDRALLPHFRKALSGSVYSDMIQAMKKARRIIFSGCGATGRLAILLESAWNEIHPGSRKILSIMTGGDYALIRSVENFEDSAEGGRRQLHDLEFTKEDILVGITATGETASILGSAIEAANAGAEVFMLICVPVQTAVSRLERCRELYRRKNTHVIDMHIGGMAVTGSTRMQSSSIEQLVAASAIEKALCGSEIDYPAAFESLLDSLENSVDAIAECIDFETETYKKGGLIDYLADDLLVDLLSDTTERSPTFMIPPYKPEDDLTSPEPWAMARNVKWNTETFWEKCLRRPVRCIEWTPADYEREGISHLIKKGIPKISSADLFRIPLAGETPESRRSAYQVKMSSSQDGPLFYDGRKIGDSAVKTPLRLFEHLRMKLAMNIISTGTMVRLGRVRSNYMIYLAISNKKLIDRACRIISEQCHIPYEQACYELFRTESMIDTSKFSPVAETIFRLERGSL